MIFCETGGSDSAAYDALAVFLSQLRAHELPVVVAGKSMPEDLSAAHQFDLSSFISNANPQASDSLLILQAEELSQVKANEIRNFAKCGSLQCMAMGHFQTRQSEITISSRIAHAVNQEPVLFSPPEIAGLPYTGVPIFAAPVAHMPRSKPTVGLFFPDLEKPNAREAIRALALSSRFTIEIITTGAEKQKWIDVDGYNVPVWHLGELLPRALAARFDAAVLFAKPSTWPRFQMLVANLTLAGAALIDATMDRLWQQSRPEMIAGPVQISDLADWLTKSILPNLDEIKDTVTSSSLAAYFKLPDILAGLREPPLSQKPARKAVKPPVLFIPTNGVGLGHAKRCSLIADAMRDAATPQFGAFPSCIGMLTASGFDTVPLVSRTQKQASHKNDIVNLARLSAAAKEAKITVFDGGYVFDSVMRAAADHGRRSVWVRRGLWQASQNNQVALDRQKTFSRIVVPSEAFDELNAPARYDENLVQVGPIVQQTLQDTKEKATLRKQLEDNLGLHGKHLVVTMLGGGVAADRRAQVNTVCAHLEGRSDVMHVLVVWPTATTDPGWFQYQNTRVVQSVHASVLVQMADLFVSAIGYNSFHEALYGKVPTIFVPQMASFMDDQRARGKAAADREVAIMLEPWELLTLTKKIDECLDGQSDVLRENLRGLNLPEPGIGAAAQSILEIAQ